jgi:hypothetical protein
MNRSALNSLSTEMLDSAKTFHRFTGRAGSDRMSSLPCFALSLRGNRTVRR